MFALFYLILFYFGEQTQADNITLFQEAHPSLDSYWRSVILLGRNVASYKFALARIPTYSGLSPELLHHISDI